MIHLSIDLETYSDVNLKKAGLYRYVQSPAFEILLFAYSLDGAPTQVVDMAQGEKIPLEVVHALTDPQCLKHAYNAAFEWYCLSKYMGAQLPPAQWRDTMLHGLYAGYTAGLDATGRALGIPEDKQKLTTGKALIRYFCVPCKPTKANGGRTRNYPHHDPEKWELFKTYNGQDVVAEMEIERRLSVFPVPDFVQKQWETDLLINARGVAVDMDFCEGALELGETIRAQLTDEAVQLSGLQNPNSVKQLARWLSAETGDDKHGWFTRGDCKAYDKLLKMPYDAKGKLRNITTTILCNMAQAITQYSDPETYEILEFEGILYCLGEICHTCFSVED